MKINTQRNLKEYLRRDPSLKINRCCICRIDWTVCLTTLSSIRKVFLVNRYISNMTVFTVLLNITVELKLKHTREIEINEVRYKSSI